MSFQGAQRRVGFVALVELFDASRWRSHASERCGDRVVSNLGGIDHRDAGTLFEKTMCTNLADVGIPATVSTLDASADGDGLQRVDVNVPR